MHQSLLSAQIFNTATKSYSLHNTQRQGANETNKRNTQLIYKHLLKATQPTLTSCANTTRSSQGGGGGRRIRGGGRRRDDETNHNHNQQRGEREREERKTKTKNKLNVPHFSTSFSRVPCPAPPAPLRPTYSQTSTAALLQFKAQEGCSADRRSRW